MREAVESIDPLDLEAATLITASKGQGGLLVGHSLIGSNLGSSVSMVQVLLERIGFDHKGDGLDELRTHLAAMLAGLVMRYTAAYPPPTIEISRGGHPR